MGRNPGFLAKICDLFLENNNLNMFNYIFYKHLQYRRYKS